MIDLSVLNNISNVHGIDVFTILREIIQISFLNKFYSTDVKDTYFKGGTCIRLFYSSFRFSEDLDFTTLINKKEVKKNITITVKELSKEFEDINFKELDSIAGYSFKLSYPSEISKQAVTVKLDFSDRENVLDPKVGTVHTKLPVLSGAVIKHLSDKEILAEKIRATMTRNKGRDLFDLWYLLSKGVEYDEGFIQKKLDYYKEKYDKEKLISKIKSWDQNRIDSDVRKFLPVKDRSVIGVLKDVLNDKLSKIR